METLFGILLLGLMTIVFGAAYPIATRMQDQARYRAQAVRLARRELELLRQVKFDYLLPPSAANLALMQTGPVQTVSGLTPDSTAYLWTTMGPANDTVAAMMPLVPRLDAAGQPVLDASNNPLSDPSGEGRVYIENVVVANPNASPVTVQAAVTKLRRVTVQVSWQGRNGSHRISLVTLKGNPQ